MDIERKNAVTLKGKPFKLIGPEIKVGQKAPDFAVLGSDPSPVTLASSRGKTRLLVSVTSLDTASGTESDSRCMKRRDWQKRRKVRSWQAPS